MMRVRFEGGKENLAETEGGGLGGVEKNRGRLPQKPGAARLKPALSRQKGNRAGKDAPVRLLVSIRNEPVVRIPIEL